MRLKEPVMTKQCDARSMCHRVRDNVRLQVVGMRQVVRSDVGDLENRGSPAGSNARVRAALRSIRLEHEAIGAVAAVTDREIVVSGAENWELGEAQRPAGGYDADITQDIGARTIGDRVIRREAQIRCQDALLQIVR